MPDSLKHPYRPATWRIITPADNHPDERPELALLFTLIGAACSFAFALRSDGVYHDDDLTHFHIAAWAWADPRHLLSIWGRPGCTLFYFPAAAFGWTAARLFSVVAATLTAGFTFAIAARMRIRAAWLAPAFYWLGPLAFTLSFSTVTETAMAFYLAAAMLLFLRGNHAWSAAVLSLCFVTRYESVVLAPLWLVAMGRRNRPIREIAGLAWAPLAHNLIGRLFLDSWPFETFLHPRPTSYYGQAGWLQMPAQLSLSSGAALSILAAAGLGTLRKCRGGTLWIAAAALYLATHAVIYRFGLFASGGYARFLAPIQPVVAVAAAASVSNLMTFIRNERPARDRKHFGDATNANPLAGPLVAALAAQVFFWQAVDSINPAWLWSGMKWPLTIVLLACVVASLVRFRSPALRIAPALAPALLLVLALGQSWSEARPLMQNEDQHAVREAVDWLRTSEFTDRPWQAANQWVWRFLGRTQPFDQPRTIDALNRLPAGGIFIWDANYCPHPDHGLPLEAIRARDDLREIWHGRAHSRLGVYCRIFERLPPATARSDSERSHE